MTKPRISSLDWQILSLLQEDGRRSISEIAKQLDRSRSNISEHLERLQDSGILKRFSIEIDLEKLGFGVTASVRLQASSANHRKIINALCELPEVIECHVLTGTELVIMRVGAKDMPHLRSIVDSFTKYGATQTDVIFSSVKQGIRVNEQLQNALLN